MSGDVRERVSDHFAAQSDRADVWRAFDLVLETDAYLNLGYSPWYRPHPLGSSQRRLVSEVGARLAAGNPPGRGLLDVGCGRGGPATQLASEFGFGVTGIDLVPYNVARAREHARERGVGTAFVVGDATALPFDSGSFAACAAVDSLVYVPDRRAVFDGVADVLEPGGVVAVTDLVRAPNADLPAVDAFADAWDMPPLDTAGTYVQWVEDAGLRLERVEDLSAQSVGRFRRYTTPFLWLVDGPFGGAIERAISRFGLQSAVVLDQIRRAHRALPDLRHVLLTARKPET
jgi:ubiquinone/menaquinone biosynthesis C-methylase UbiE